MAAIAAAVAAEPVAPAPGAPIITLSESDRFKLTTASVDRVVDDADAPDPIGGVLAAEDDDSGPIAVRTPIFAPRTRTPAHTAAAPVPAAAAPVAAATRTAAVATPSLPKLQRLLATVASQLDAVTASATAQGDILRNVGQRQTQLEQRLDAVSSGVREALAAAAAVDRNGGLKRSRSDPSAPFAVRDDEEEPHADRKRGRPAANVPAEAVAPVKLNSTTIAPLPIAAKAMPQAAVNAILSSLDSDMLRGPVVSWLAQDMPGAPAGTNRLEAIASNWYFSSTDDSNAFVAAAGYYLGLPPGSFHPRARKFTVDVIKDVLRADNRNAIAKRRDTIISYITALPCMTTVQLRFDASSALWFLLQHDHTTVAELVHDVDDDFEPILLGVLHSSQGIAPARFERWQRRRTAYVMASLMVAFIKRSRDMTTQMTSAGCFGALPDDAVAALPVALADRAAIKYRARGGERTGAARCVAFGDLCAVIEEELEAGERPMPASRTSAISSTVSSSQVKVANGAVVAEASSSSTVSMTVLQQQEEVTYTAGHGATTSALMQLIGDQSG